MRIEYLILNGLILSGPLFLSFDREVRYVRFWKQAGISILLVMAPFLCWDAAVTGRHWHFNTEYVVPLRFLGLPPGEILFFITVPFACLFIWQIIVTRRPEEPLVKNEKWLMGVSITGWAAAGLFLAAGRDYTAIVCAAAGFTVLLDRMLGTHILSQRRTGRFLLMLFGLILVFNGYLTARPVVIYDPRYLTGIRIWTIPWEDFIYGLVLILGNTMVFERLKKRRRHA